MGDARLDELAVDILANGLGVTSLLGSRVATKSTLDNCSFILWVSWYIPFLTGVLALLLLPWPILHRTRTRRLGTQQRPQPASLWPPDSLCSRCCVLSSFFASAHGFYLLRSWAASALSCASLPTLAAASLSRM